MKVIVFKYTPEVLNDIKPYNLVLQVHMLPVGMNKSQNMCFNPLLWGKKCILFAPIKVTGI